jgi:hypothetical protein
MAITDFTGIMLNTLQTVALTNHTAVAITVPDTSDFIMIEAHSHPIRIRFDGVDPTASVGFTIPKDTATRVDVGIGTTLKIITQSGSTNVYWQAFRTKRDNNA